MQICGAVGRRISLFHQADVAYLALKLSHVLLKNNGQVVLTHMRDSKLLGGLSKAESGSTSNVLLAVLLWALLALAVLRSF